MGGATDAPAIATGLESNAIAPDRAPEPVWPAPILSRAPAESVQAPPAAPAASAVATPGVAKPAETVTLPAETPAVASYLPSSALDMAPRPLDDIDPLIPEEARGRAGSVVLQLFISAQGVVDRVEVLHSNPPGLFDASAVAAATRVRFSPGYVAGVAVDGQVTREVTFQGKGSGKDTAGRSY
jgi:protein TonB